MRAARRESESGYYHVVARGNGKQIIFESDDDRATFVRMLGESSSAVGVGIIAWCLMENHVHMVLEDAEGRMSEAMRTLLSRYARYFNERTGHVGHVFQERFFSEPIEGDSYLLAAVRYVHLNPERAGVCPAGEYRWSSYQEYLGAPGLTRTETVLDMVQGPEGFIALCSDDGGAVYVPRLGCGMDENARLRVATEVLSAAGLGAPGDVKGLSRARRDAAIRLLGEKGFSIRWIERLTGVGRGTIAYVLSGGREEPDR